MHNYFKLRFSPHRIQSIADRYRDLNEDHILEDMGSEIQKRRYLDKPEFMEMCYWKTPRTRTRCAENSEDLIQETTRIALGTPCEELRIKILLALNGVSWPTASVLLHFGYDNLYPILDYRALWSLGIEKSLPTISSSGGPIPCTVASLLSNAA